MAELCPAGQYIGSVVANKTTPQESSTGNGQVVLTVDFGNGFTRRIWLTFAPGKAEEIAKETLGRLGWNGEFEDKAVFSSGDSQEWYCQHKPDTKNPGQQRENWGLSKGAGAGKPLAKDKAMLLSAKFRAAAGGTASIPNSKPPSSPRKGPPAASPPPANFTKDSAWAEWEERVTDASRRETGWIQVIRDMGDETGGGDKFTSEQWKQVFAAASIPF